MSAIKLTLIDQLVAIAGAELTECVEWHGATNNLGYPYMKYRGVVVPVRRMAFAIYKNGPQSGPWKGGRIMMMCNDKKCVNPFHMYEEKK